MWIPANRDGDADASTLVGIRAGAVADNGNRFSQAIFDNSSTKPSGRA